jgi:hypothetical protein
VDKASPFEEQDRAAQLAHATMPLICLATRTGLGLLLVEQADEDALARRQVLTKYQPPGSKDLSSWG